MLHRLAPLAFAIAPLAWAVPAAAQISDEWSAEKCRLYGKAWDAAIASFGTDGIGSAFFGNHQAFLASNCTNPHNVCPISPREIELANLLTVMSMNEGMASTFVPFACPRD